MSKQVTQLTLGRPPAFSWARRFQLRQRLLGSLWIVPLLGAVAGAALGSADAWDDPGFKLPAGWQYSASTASGILTTIIAAMVGLFGFVVTISVLVVQMATGTLSPRFMRLWYRDRLQKLVLATFVGTVAFAFTVMRGITDDSVPSLGVSVASLAFIVNLILLLLYLDRFAHNLRPVSVGAMVGRRGLGEAPHAAARAAGADVSVARASNPFEAGTPVSVVGLRKGGAVQAIQLGGLIREAVRQDCAIEMTCSVGDFVPAASPIANIHAAGGTPDASAVAATIALGQERSIEDDPSFAMRIMVDIAIRALSPAVNDPTTAVQLINQIETLIRGLVPYLDEARHLVVTDGQGVVRLVVPVRNFEDYLRLAVTEIREYGGASTQVCRRLRAMLLGLSGIVDPASRQVVEAELASLDRTIAGHFPNAGDRAFARHPDRQGIGGPAEH